MEEQLHKQTIAINTENRIAQTGELGIPKDSPIRGITEANGEATINSMPYYI